MTPTPWRKNSMYARFRLVDEDSQGNVGKGAD